VVGRAKHPICLGVHTLEMPQRLRKSLLYKELRDGFLGRVRKAALLQGISTNGDFLSAKTVLGEGAKEPVTKIDVCERIG